MTDVVVVGAGPTGLMLAAELRLAGVRPLVLERRTRLRTTPKANGLGGQILRLLRCRGLLERLEAAAPGATHPAPIFPFGDVYLDFSHLADPPMWGLSIPQPELERVLDERAGELGAEVRRGHEVVGVGQDEAGVTADVRGPDGPYRVSARYLVGCDGPRSRVREAAGIGFPGVSYPEVHRLGQVAVHESVTRLDNGDLDVPVLGLLRSGFTRTDRGAFAFGWLTPETLMLTTTEDDHGAPDDEVPMDLTELQDSVRRVLGADLPLGEPRRLSRYTFEARQAERYREGRILLAGDAAHQFPATGIGLNVGMLDAVNLAWKLAADVHGRAPAGLVETYHGERHPAGARGLVQTQAQVAVRRGHDPAADALRQVLRELFADGPALRRMGGMLAGTDVQQPAPGPGGHPLTGVLAPDLTLHTDEGEIGVAQLLCTARPILLELADRPDLREIARGWQDRVEIHTATTGDRPADAILVRPDAHVAWAAAVDEPGESAAPLLRDALTSWFGPPVEATSPVG